MSDVSKFLQKNTLCLLFVALSFCFSNIISAQTTQPKPYTADWESLDARPTPDWWQDAKFGIFIHWGVYSVPAYTTKGNYAEWYQNSLVGNLHEGKIQAYHQANFGDKTYYDLADDFHAELFNPDDWAALFEKAGAKYVVLTSKHHDGFCLWPSKEASKSWGFPWSADVRGPHRDLVGDLFKALQKTTVKPGLYYSLYEWYNPLWKFDPSRYASDHAMPQLYDLVQKYQPWIIWADGDWDATPETWQSPKFLAWLYNQSPVRDRVVVNDRWGSGVRFKHAGIYTPEYQPDVDFENHPWEESRGMGASYGYNRAEDITDYNSSQSLVLHLIDKVSRGGNFLLDIGPDAHGLIPPVMQERLLDIGKWLSVNGEAIYGARRWRNDSQWSAGNRDFKPELMDGWKTGGDVLLKQTVDPEPGFAVKEIFYTWNPKTKNLYAVFPRYPDGKKLSLKGFQLPLGTEVSLLETGQKLKWENIAAARANFDDRPGDDYKDVKNKKQALGVSEQEVAITLPEFSPNKFKSQYAYVLKIANFGAFMPKPVISVKYDPKTLLPSVSITSTEPDAVIRYTTDGTEPTESATAYKQEFTLKAAATIRAKAFKKGLLESPEVSEQVKMYQLMPSMSMLREPASALRMQVLSTEGKYNAANISEGHVEKAAEVADFTLDPACSSGNCGMIWKGFIKAPQTAGYRFWTDSDDGSLLYIDNQLVVDNDGDHGSEEKTGMALLQQGWHQFKLVYFNSGGAANLKVSWKAGDGPKQAIPAEDLAH
ncbi:MAG: alpha-L-fucosidase [Bacteroidota bacterium]